jgi:phosphoribosyl 1,2-cyclic phosphodiesterase
VISSRGGARVAAEIQVAVLSSGSRGNCTYVTDGSTGVLIDCGPSTKQILLRLEQIGLAGSPIDAVVITHEHSDHAGSCRILCDRLEKIYGRPVPFYMTQGTRAALKERMLPAHFRPVVAGESFQVGALIVDPFRVPHDVSDPVAYRVGLGGRWVGVVTDLGRSTRLVSEKLRSLSIAVLEFNHDLEMLLDGPYAWPVKQRIRSSHGHLSNDQAGELLAESVGDCLEHVVLAHLSEENNSPDKALLRAAQALHSAGAAERVKIHLAQQNSALLPLTVSTLRAPPGVSS